LHLETCCTLETTGQDTTSDEVRCFEAIDLAEKTLGVIERLSERGVLPYMQDAAASLLSKFTAHLVKVGHLIFEDSTTYDL